ncbi:MAG: hypothetical protein JO189_31440 [Deltaproteobacteria bacterium]|nr:hypothetical protein [Deltaproteobacteria bacterium]
MSGVHRRVVLVSIAALAAPFPAYSGSPEECNVNDDEGGAAIAQYAADRAGKRPAALVLHGNRGVEFNPPCLRALRQRAGR